MSSQPYTRAAALPELLRQQKALVDLGCDELQGYLFARPMSARLLTHWAMGEAEAEAHDRHAGHQDFRPSLFMEEFEDALPTLLMQ